MVSTMVFANDIEVVNSDGVTIYYQKINDSEFAVSRQGNSPSYSGNVVIPGTVDYEGKTYKVTHIDTGAFYHCNGLTSVTIPNSVTHIGGGAFFECWYLTSVVIPNSVVYIGAQAFYNCPSLNSITIPDKVSIIEMETFYGCKGLTSVTIPNSVASIRDCAFLDCTDLTSISIPNSVTYIGNGAFLNTGWYKNQSDGLLYLDKWLIDCKGDEPTGDISITEGSKGIATLALSGCSGITSVTIPTSVRSINSFAFNGCTSLTSVTIPSSVTSIGSGWYNNQSDGLLYLDNWLMGYKGDAPTGEITIADGTIGIADNAFYNCSGITSVNIPNSMKSIRKSAFYNTGWYNNQSDGLLYLDNWLLGYKSNISNVYHPMPAGKITIADGTIGIADEAFFGCIDLTSVTIPGSVKSINSYAFYGCTCLTSVTIPSSVTSIGEYAFSNTGWYHSQSDGLLYLDNWLIGYKGDKPTGEITIAEGTIGIADFAFYGCEGITSISIPNSVEIIGRSAFYNTGWYKNQSDGLLYLDDWLIGYKGEKPTGEITIADGTRGIADFAFYGCEDLTSVNIPDGITSVGDNAFSNTEWYNNQSDGLLYLDNWLIGYKGNKPTGEITIADGTIGIADKALSDCNGITSVTIPGSVTSIGKDAFSNTGWYNNQSDGLLYLGNWLIGYKGNKPTGEITIADGTIGIADKVLSGCNGITSVAIPGSVTSIGKDAFSNTGWYNNQSDGLLYLGNWLIGYKGDKPTGGITIAEGTIGIADFAFDGCIGLSSLTIPGSMTTIGRCAFSGCNNLLNIYCYAKKAPSISENEFVGFSSNITLHVLSASIEAYKAKMPWKTFKDIVSLEHTLTYMVDDKVYKTYEIIEGNVIPEEAAPQKEGYTFSGWSDIPEKMPAHNVVILGSFVLTGDANVDKKVNAADIVEMINYRKGNPSNIFNKIAADLNRDNEIDKTDIEGVINIIMGKSK